MGKPLLGPECAGRESEEFERAAAVGESSLTGTVSFGGEKVPLGLGEEGEEAWVKWFL